jgi:hypothetical protein
MAVKNTHLALLICKMIFEGELCSPANLPETKTALVQVDSFSKAVIYKITFYKIF